MLPRVHDYKLIKIKRLKTLSGNKLHYVATATADASIQPLGKEGGNIRDGFYAGTFIAYVDDDVSVQKGDKVIDHNGHEYNVSDVVIRDVGCFPYKELIIKKTS